MISMSTSGLAAGPARHDRKGKARSPAMPFFRALRDRLRDQRQYRELEQLPDYLLDDVGLTRADIAATSRRRRSRSFD